MGNACCCCATRSGVADETWLAEDLSDPAAVRWQPRAWVVALDSENRPVAVAMRSIDPTFVLAYASTETSSEGAQPPGGTNEVATGPSRRQNYVSEAEDAGQATVALPRLQYESASDHDASDELTDISSDGKSTAEPCAFTHAARVAVTVLRGRMQHDITASVDQFVPIPEHPANLQISTGRVHDWRQLFRISDGVLVDAGLEPPLDHADADSRDDADDRRSWDGERRRSAVASTSGYTGSSGDSAGLNGRRRTGRRRAPLSIDSLLLHDRMLQFKHAERQRRRAENASHDGSDAREAAAGVKMWLGDEFEPVPLTPTDDAPHQRTVSIHESPRGDVVDHGRSMPLPNALYSKSTTGGYGARATPAAGPRAAAVHTPQSRQSHDDDPDPPGSRRAADSDDVAATRPATAQRALVSPPLQVDEFLSTSFGLETNSAADDSQHAAAAV